MMRRFLTALVGALGVMAIASAAEAQEIQLTGPLAGAPATRHMRLYRKGRFEVAPTASFTLLDEYRRTILFGGRLQYNITDWLGIGGWGAFGAISTTTDLSDQIDAVAPRNARTAVNIPNCPPGSAGCPKFGDQLAKMQWVAAPQVQFVPFRGKLAIFQQIFVDTDAYLHAGVAFIGLQERGDCGTGTGGAADCITPNKSFALQNRTAIAPTFGLGLSFYASDFISLGVEYRALPFSWNRAGFDSAGSGPNQKFPDNKIDSNDQSFKFNQMITIAVGFSLPTKPGISE